MNQAKSMVSYVTNAFDTIDSGITAASRLLHGDISVLFKSGSSDKGFVEAIQRMWRSGRRTIQDATTLLAQQKSRRYLV
ncbi:hypothetical protein [Arsenophonus endosymbiont of Aleurodicus floccissimus]|uniref:hypothetical protein n=1 Tax=Arsenophonus endosymbiont of Aleurodicus floccissimus TaxID=2152761 RepID=UPI001EDF4AA8|nr:hypothetical protein [Arsenophonus endosymbiont of Aleurodicus floccissimus]